MLIPWICFLYFFQESTQAIKQMLKLGAASVGTTNVGGAKVGGAEVGGAKVGGATGGPKVGKQVSVEELFQGKNNFYFVSFICCWSSSRSSYKRTQYGQASVS